MITSDLESGNPAHPSTLTAQNNHHQVKGPVVWEVRGHSTDADSKMPSFAIGGSGTVVPGGEEGLLQGKAVWLMGRRVGDVTQDSDGPAQS